MEPCPPSTNPHSLPQHGIRPPQFTACTPAALSPQVTSFLRASSVSTVTAERAVGARWVTAPSRRHVHGHLRARRRCGVAVEKRPEHPLRGGETPRDPVGPWTALLRRPERPGRGQLFLSPILKGWPCPSVKAPPGFCCSSSARKETFPSVLHIPTPLQHFTYLGPLYKLAKKHRCSSHKIGTLGTDNTACCHVCHYFWRLASLLLSLTLPILCCRARGPNLTGMQVSLPQIRSCEGHKCITNTQTVTQAPSC